MIVALDARAVMHVLDQCPFLGDKMLFFPVFPTLHHIYGDGCGAGFDSYFEIRLLRAIVAAGNSVLQADADVF